MPERVEAVAAYLAERDTPCPGCGYNLRGVEGGTCPECGLAIELVIARPERWWGGRAPLVLLLAWLLLAGGMNATRAGFAIERAGTVVTVQGAVIAPPSLPTLTITMPSSPAQTGNARQLQVYTDALSAYRTQARQMLSQIPGTRSTAFSWAAVPTERYLAFGAWALLGLGGAAGLTIALVMWRRDRPRLRRAALAIAWLGFGGYFAFHASVFAREIAARL
jgi:hypothetical protein